MLANPAATVGMADGSMISNLSNEAAVRSVNGLTGSEGKVAPKAYLNFLQFDKELKQVDRGYDQVTTEASITEESLASPHEELELEVIAKEAGYIFTYLSHEENENIDIYFDDFTLAVAAGPVIQVDDYYPFGMAFNHELLANEVLNRYLYQGKEKYSTKRTGTIFMQDCTVRHWEGFWE